MLYNIIFFSVYIPPHNLIPVFFDCRYLPEELIWGILTLKPPYITFLLIVFLNKAAHILPTLTCFDLAGEGEKSSVLVTTFSFC